VPVVVRAPAAPLAGLVRAGPAGRASVIDFEQGHAHVCVMFALGDALAVMEAVLLEQLTGSLWPDPAVLAAAGALSRGVRVGEVAADLGLTPG
jgi:hypothetical protein